MRHRDETFKSPVPCGACAHEPVCGLFDRCEPVSKQSPQNLAGEMRVPVSWAALRAAVGA